MLWSAYPPMIGDPVWIRAAEKNPATVGHERADDEREEHDPAGARPEATSGRLVETDGAQRKPSPTPVQPEIPEHGEHDDADERDGHEAHALRHGVRELGADRALGMVAQDKRYPWMMLSVPSVAMIEGRPITRISVALKMPVARPTPTIASAPTRSRYHADPASS